MSHRNLIRNNKTELQETLCGDYTLILNKVFQKKGITQREYNNLKSINKCNVEDHVIELVDKIMNKGEDSCRNFLDLLQTDEEIQETFPSLKNIPLNAIRALCVTVQATTVCTESVQEVVKKKKKEKLYRLQSQPVGLCVIINNEKFIDGTMRNGTDKDAESLAEVFSWLGFNVLMCKDQTKDEMKQMMMCLASLTDPTALQDFNVHEWFGGQFIGLQRVPHHGDAFICCFLSHGQKGAVLGTDYKPLFINKITSFFRGSEMSPLTGKPKVFLIQACQGTLYQKGVLLKDLEIDGSNLQYIPKDADVLVAFTTVEDHASIRHTTDGSWFVQSVCQQLKECCQSDENCGEDINVILNHVKNEVSKMEGSRIPGEAKQMPVVRSTLRKKLVLKPSHLTSPGFIPEAVGSATQHRIRARRQNGTEEPCAGTTTQIRRNHYFTHKQCILGAIFIIFVLFFLSCSKIFFYK